MDHELSTALARIGLRGLRAGADAGIVAEPSAMRPLEAARRLIGSDRLVFLDSGRATARSGRRSYVAADPFLVVRSRAGCVELSACGGTVEIAAEPFAVVTQLLRHLRLAAPPGLPAFIGGAIGSFAYDLGRRLERLPHRLAADPDLPELDVAFYDRVLAFDHETDTGWMIALDLGVERRGGGGGVAGLATMSAPAPAHAGAQQRIRFRSNVARDDYLSTVRRVLEAIAAGELYQVNLSQRLEAGWSGSAWDAYELLRSASPAPYGAFLDLGDAAVLSASPEQFLRLDGDRIETRPMKGTRPRGADADADRALAVELAASVKDRAENAMIVDVLRNDLGRVCRTGGVRVDDLFAIEPYAGVWQMVSSVRGRLRPECDAVDLLRACFPGGSITGAPKIRAMELIEELERVRRGIYCGAIGYLSVTGAMDTSVAIRTVVLAGERLLLQVGGGIVADSDPAAEYAETLVKAQAVIAAFGGELEEW
jgi:para-aminobenzoate synthetase component 1